MEQDNKLQQLERELQIARLSQPSDKALQQYYQLSGQIEQLARPSLWAAVKATLSWDSRDELMARGVRGAAHEQSYRLLFDAEQTEIEVMVEAQAQHHFIVGDIVPGDTGFSSEQSLALITLMPLTGGATPHEVESDADGRFHIENISKGAYTMQLMMFDGKLIELPAIELG